MPFTEDLTAFHSTDEFSTSATYTAQGGGTPTTVKGIFDTNWLNPLGAEGYETVYRGILSDYASPKKGDAFTINSVNYTVIEAKRNEPTPGEILFRLTKA